MGKPTVMLTVFAREVPSRVVVDHDEPIEPVAVSDHTSGLPAVLDLTEIIHGSHEQAEVGVDCALRARSVGRTTAATTLPAMARSTWGNGDQPYWQCVFCRVAMMRVGRRHRADLQAWFDIEPCERSGKALLDPHYLKPKTIRRQQTATGIVTPEYPWPAESATLEGKVKDGDRAPKPKGRGKTPRDQYGRYTSWTPDEWNIPPAHGASAAAETPETGPRVVLPPGKVTTAGKKELPPSSSEAGKTELPPSSSDAGKTEPPPSTSDAAANDWRSYAWPPAMLWRSHANKMPHA